MGGGQAAAARAIAVAASKASAADGFLDLLEKALRLGAFVAGLGAAEFLEQFALFRAQPGRGFDHDPHHQIAAPPALEHWHTGTALAHFAARLDAGCDLDLIHRAVEPWDRDRSAERRRGEADRRVGVERGPFALENGVALHMQEDIEVARRRAARPSLAFARQPDARAFIDPGGDIDGQRLGLFDASLAAAVATRVCNHFARAAPRGALTALAPAHELAEHAFENVGKAAEILAAPAAALLERGMPEPIVRGALLRILEAVIGSVDRLELGLVFLAAPVHVGVIIHRELAVRRLDRRIVRPALDLEQLVIIDFGTHRRPPPPSRRAMPE